MSKFTNAPAPTAAERTNTNRPHHSHDGAFAAAERALLGAGIGFTAIEGSSPDRHPSDRCSVAAA